MKACDLCQSELTPQQLRVASGYLVFCSVDCYYNYERNSHHVKASHLVISKQDTVSHGSEEAYKPQDLKLLTGRSSRTKKRHMGKYNPTVYSGKGKRKRKKKYEAYYRD